MCRMVMHLCCVQICSFSSSCFAQWLCLLLSNPEEGVFSGGTCPSCCCKQVMDLEVMKVQTKLKMKKIFKNSEGVSGKRPEIAK